MGGGGEAREKKERIDSSADHEHIMIRLPTAHWMQLGDNWRTDIRSGRIESWAGLDHNFEIK